MQANLKDQFDQQYISLTNTFKEESGTSPQWKDDVSIACNALKNIVMENPHESSKKQSVVDVIERFIRGKTAEECRRKFDYDLSVGFIKVRKDQINFNKRDAKNDDFKHRENETTTTKMYVQCKSEIDLKKKE